MKLCTSCVKNQSLVDYISQNGDVISKCLICGNDNQKILAAYTPQFKNLFKTLIRYYFSEWDYHSKLGGEDLRSILFNTNPITNHTEEMEDIDDYYWCSISELMDPMIDNDGISIISAYGRDVYSCQPIEALTTKDNAPLNLIADKLQVKNHFTLETETKALLHTILTEIVKTIPIDSHLYRARIGYQERARLGDYSSKEICHYLPFAGNAIGAPPLGLSSFGRLNRHGVSFLYLATKVDTAIAEVRPHPGQYVSIGQFRSNRPIKIADFANINFLPFSANEKRLEDLHLIATIDRVLREPVPPDKRHLYCLPQLLSDVFRQEGFDGIMFNSSVSDGMNLTIFDPDDFSYVDNDAAVHLIREVTYRYECQDKIDPNEVYIATQKHSETSWCFTSDN